MDLDQTLLAVMALVVAVFFLTFNGE